MIFVLGLLFSIVYSKKIAIIGCGAGGSSSAYFLREHDVTIFEKENRCGGRIYNIMAMK